MASGCFQVFMALLLILGKIPTDALAADSGTPLRPEFEFDQQYELKHAGILTLDETIHYRGERAEWARQDLVTRGEEAFKQDILKGLSTQLNDLEILKPIEIHRQHDGSLVVKGSYRSRPKIEHDGMIRVDLGGLIDAGFPEEAAKLRYPNRIRVNLSLRGGDFEIDPVERHVETQYYRSSMQWKTDDERVMRAVFTFESLADAIPPEAWPQYIQDRDSLRAAGAFYFSPDPVGPSKAAPASTPYVIGTLFALVALLSLAFPTFRRYRASRNHAPTQAEAGSSYQHPLLFSESRQWIDTLLKKPCATCAGMRFDMGPEESFRLNGDTLISIDRICTQCNTKTSFYGKQIS